MTKKQEENLFVRLKNSQEVERDILLTLKSAIETIQDYENLRSIRKEKTHLFNLELSNINFNRCFLIIKI